MNPNLSEITNILPANESWGYKPNILTDLAISIILNKVHKSISIQHTPIYKIVTAMEYMAQSMRMHLPMAGEQYCSITSQLQQEINTHYLTEYSSFEMLSGNGPVGKYIADYIEMFKLCDEVNHTGLYNPACVDMEEEYKQIFDYKPQPCKVNNEWVDEFTKIIALTSKLQKFGYLTQFQNTPSSDKFKINVTLDTQSNNFNFTHNSVNKTGIYFSESSWSTKVPNLLILVAPIRDTKVACIINLSYNSNCYNGRLYYFHRAENQWVNSSDQYSNWFLEGTYEALEKEAEKFLGEIGYSLSSDFTSQVIQCFEYFKRLDSCSDVMSTQGLPNTLSDYFKDIKLFPKQGLIFSFKDIEYNYTELSITDNKVERLTINKKSDSSWNSTKYSIIVERSTDGIRTNIDVDEIKLILTFLLDELNKHFYEQIQKIEELIAPQYKEETNS